MSEPPAAEPEYADRTSGVVDDHRHAAAHAGPDSGWLHAAGFAADWVFALLLLRMLCRISGHWPSHWTLLALAFLLACAAAHIESWWARQDERRLTA